jgi:hypothetical protein
MIQGINSYKLDTDIALYSGSLVPFGTEAYELAKSFGRPRRFKGELYYWALDNNFLGRTCAQAMISAINGTIRKIAFRFHDTNSDACVQIREAAYSFIADQLGPHRQFAEVGSDHKVFMWGTPGGNVVLELDCFDTEIVLTSASVWSAKELSFLDRLLGRH